MPCLRRLQPSYVIYPGSANVNSQWPIPVKTGRLKCVTKSPTHRVGRRGHAVPAWIFFLTRCGEPIYAVQPLVGP